MAQQIVRSPEEIETAYDRAQKAYFDAEDTGDDFPEAQAVYDFMQWAYGNQDNDPTKEFEEAG